MNEKFQKAIADRRARQQQQQVQAKVSPIRNDPEITKALLEQFADMVPNVSDDVQADAPLTDDQQNELQLDQLISRISILDAYKMFCGKMTPKVAPGQYESIMISCPSAAHADRNPSAWVNTRSNLWKCHGGKCDADGGGVIDLVGATMGILSATDRKGKNYHDIRRHIGRSYGWDFVRKSSGSYVAIPPGARAVEPVRIGSESGTDAGDTEAVRQDDGVPAHGAADAAHVAADAGNEQVAPAAVQQPGPGTDQPVTADGMAAPAVAPAPVADPAAGTVATVVPLAQLDEDSDNLPDMNWRAVFQEESFIRSYMVEASNDDVPEMYHMAHALLGIGMCLGRNVTLADRWPVYGNLLVCLLGRSGEGKSKSRGYINSILAEVLPYDESEPFPTGAKFISSPSSGEGLVTAFRRFEKINGKPTGKVLGDVKALVDYGELAGLTGRASRLGNIIKPTILEFYDCQSRIGFTNKMDGEVVAMNAYASFATTSQPDKLSDLLSKGDTVDGFLNRWNFFTGTSKRKMSLFTAPVDFAVATAQLQQIAQYAAATHTLGWTDGAYEAWDSFFHTVIEPTKKADRGDMLNRADLMMKKMILLLAANKLEKNVSKETVEQAIKFWPYFIDCYKLIDKSVGAPKSNQIEEKILQIIRNFQAKNKGKYITKGMLRTRTRHLSLSSDEFLKALMNLEKMDEIKERPSIGAGRPTTLFEAVSQ